MDDFEFAHPGFVPKFSRGLSRIAEIACCSKSEARELADRGVAPILATGEGNGRRYQIEESLFWFWVLNYFRNPAIA